MVVATWSVAVLVFLVLFAVAAPSSKLSADFGPVVPRPGDAVTVEGRVTGPSGNGLEGAEIEVRSQGMSPVRRLADASGAFRVAFDGSCSQYVLALSAESGGDTVETTSRHRLCPGDSLPVDARVVTQGHFLWIPGPR